jgi:uncharacterized protein YciI
VFVILLDYVEDLRKVDEALDDHREWLRKHYDAGLFLASGPQEPRTGGMIFAAGDRSLVEAAVAGDPFGVRGVAHHTIVEFHPTAFGGPLDDERIRRALG